MSHQSLEPPIQITFSIASGEEDDPAARFNFWDSSRTIQWFKYHGYTLYQREGDTATLYPTFPSSNPDINSICYPFAHYDTETSYDAPPLAVSEYSGKVAYAQDSLHRHVVIKIVPAESDEYRILRFLNQQNLDTMERNCIIPVLDMLPVEGFYFVVMPRWGHGINSPPLSHVQDVVTITHSFLKGLSYLHENNIVHGDIALRNIVLNHFSDQYRQHTQTRRELRYTKRLMYAIIDFDLSIMLPPHVNKSAFRLPYYRSWGTWKFVRDTEAGEFDYNPFIFDVGNMGSMMCMEFQHMSKNLPMLAPLLDRMTTWDLDKRFTASEALRFFEERLSEVGDEQLHLYVQQAEQRIFYDDYDRWEGLSSDFLKKWESYKTPPVPWGMWFLRRLYEVPHFCEIIPRTRLFLHRLSHLTLQLFRWTFPLKLFS